MGRQFEFKQCSAWSARRSSEDVRIDTLTHVNNIGNKSEPDMNGAPRSGLGYADRRVNLVVLARCQRASLLVATICLLAWALLIVDALVSAPIAAQTLFRVGMVSNIALSACVTRWAAAMRVPALALAFSALVSLAPLVNLISVRVLDSDTRDLLHRAGVRPGLLGVNRADLNALHHGVCRACGYNLFGLTTDICPECGKVVRP